jgi:hypothetical protein
MNDGEPLLCAVQAEDPTPAYQTLDPDRATALRKFPALVGGHV